MMKTMKNNQIMPEINKEKENKFSRTLNINKKQFIKYKSKSNNKLDIQLTKPIKIKIFNKLKTNNQKNSKNHQTKNETKGKDNEKEKDVSLEEYFDKEFIQPINTNKNINNKINTLDNNYIKINNKTPKKIIKNIKTQLISKDIKTTNNIRNHNYNPLINGGNVKNIHGKLNLNITLNNKSPVRLRKINMNKKYGYNLDCLSTYKKEKQINTIYVNNNKNMNMDLNMNIFNNDLTNVHNTINNEESTIIKLQEEIENQKRENLYKEMLINDMKKQLDDINKDKDKNLSNGKASSSINNDILLLKQELDLLNNKISNDINDINYKAINNDKNINKEESILFDKLKNNYSNNKNLINELLNENENLKKKINDINIINEKQNKNFSYIISEKQNNISFNYIPNEHSIKINNFFSNSANNYNLNEDVDDDIISNYLENMLKSSKKDYFVINENNKINDEQKNLIKLMIQMTLNSNYIPEDEIISLFMNNLIYFQNSIDAFSIQYMKTNNYLDKEMIQNYFKLISMDEKNTFNINNIFEEIISFYDEDIKQIDKIKIEEFFAQKNNKLAQILKECKFIDSLNTGLIEINQFKNILNKFQFYKDFNEDETKIFNILLYNMKKNINLEQIGLFQLSYNNLGNDLGLELNDSFNNSSENNSLILEKNEKERKISLFGKNNEDIKIHKKITSNVDFKPDKNAKERGSGNSNNTYGLLSSNKFSFDYSSKSGSKGPDYLKDGIKELTSEFNETDEYLTIFCKEYVDNLFKTIMNDVKRKSVNVYRMSIN